MIKRMAFSFLGIVLLSSAALAQSSTQFPGDVPDTIRFKIGGIFGFLDSKVTLTSPSLPGGQVDLNSVLGEPTHKFAFRGEGAWNFAGRSFLDFGFVSFSTGHSQSISRDIDFGGVIYKAGAQVTTDSLSRYMYAAYRYGFVKNPNFQLGMSLGICYTTLRASLTASGSVVHPDGTVIAGSVTEEAGLNAPVPLLGISAEGKIVDNLSAGLSVRGFGATIKPYNGNMVEAEAHADYYFTPNFGMGGAWEWSRIDVTKTQNTKTINFIHRYDGPRLYVIATF